MFHCCSIMESENIIFHSQMVLRLVIILKDFLFDLFKRRLDLVSDKA